jgi:hypothetical protein
MSRAKGDTMKVIILAIAIFVCHASFAADLFNRQQPRPFKLAEPLEADATIGGYPIWKGDGQWRILDIVRRDSSSAKVAIGEVVLFQTKNKKLVSVMTVAAPLGGESVRWLGEPCKRDDMLFKANTGRSIWEDNCVTLNHLTNYANNPGGNAGELYAMFKEQGIETPPTVLALTFTRNGMNGNFVNVVLQVNPEAYGFAREPEVSWGRNPWNKTMSFNDPAKKQFIDALGAWGLLFSKQMDAALNQKQTAFDSIASLGNTLDGLQKPSVGMQRPAIALE